VKQKSEHPIVFFDGICNFCNGSVDFLIRHNKRKDLRYASLQSEFAQKTLDEYGISTVDLNSVYFLKDGIVYNKSTAALKLTPYLSWYIFPFYALWMFPKKFRDFFYTLIAKKRYVLLGKRESCRLPSKEEKDLFFS
jgi:predicted DCC family thiol-disulfide oxidoreductase YuxK